MSALQKPWWRSKGMEAANLVMDHLFSLRRVTSRGGVNRIRELVAWRALYMDYDSQYYKSLGIGRDRGTRSPYNITQGGVDSVHAKITLTRPRPNITSVGGRWKLQRKAMLLQRWYDAWLDHVKGYLALSNMVQDSQIYGTGWLKVVAENGQVAINRVWDGDLHTDPREERYGNVRTMYHSVAVDRDTMIQRYPKHKAHLKDLNTVDLSDAMPFEDLQPVPDNGVLDLITMVEAYRLGCSDDDPGRRMVIVKDLVLEDEPWEHKTFPFVKLIWARDPESERGQGLVERGSGVQYDLDEHATVVQRAYDTFVPKWAVPALANVSVKKINDEVGQAIVFEGQIAPTVLAPPPISPDFLNREDMLVSRYFRVTGVGEMEAGSQAPANLESGKAILAYQDVTSTRFAIQGRAYEEAAVDLCRLVMAVADGIAVDDTGALSVYGSEYDEVYDYQDVQMDSDQYVVRVMPASKLPDSIAGRLEQIGNLIKLGVLSDPQQISDLLDMPDLERNNDLASSMRKHVEKEIDLCLDEEQGIPSSYLPLEELEYAKKRANAEYHLALLGKANEDAPIALEMLRTFIGLCDQEIQALTAPPPMAPEAAPAGSLPPPDAAPPLPPGVSPPPGADVLPMVPGAV